MKEIKTLISENIEFTKSCIGFNEKSMNEEIGNLTDLTKVESVITIWQTTTIRTISSAIDECRGALWFAWYNDMITEDERKKFSLLLTEKYMELVAECYRRIS